MIDPAPFQMHERRPRQESGAAGGFSSSCTTAPKPPELMMFYCSRRVSRGRGDAMMTWKDESSADGAKFKEEALPSSTHLSDGAVCRRQQAAPELSGQEIQANTVRWPAPRAAAARTFADSFCPNTNRPCSGFFKRDE